MNYDDPSARYDAGIYYDGYVPPVPPTHMKQLKLNLSKLKRAGVIQLATNVHTALTGNANVTTPNPTLVNLQTLITSAINANNDHEAAKDTVTAKRTLRDAADLALANGLRTEANTCEVACGGDVTKLATTGFELKSDGSPIGAPEQVINLKLQAAATDGTLKASWKKARGALSYEMQTSPDPIGTWTPKGSVTTTRGVELNSFTSGQKIWMRVRGFGPGGYGAWSDPAVKTVP